MKDSHKDCNDCNTEIAPNDGHLRRAKDSPYEICMECQKLRKKQPSSEAGSRKLFRRTSTTANFLRRLQVVARLSTLETNMLPTEICCRTAVVDHIMCKHRQFEAMIRSRERMTRKGCGDFMQTVSQIRL